VLDIGRRDVPSDRQVRSGFPRNYDLVSADAEPGHVVRRNVLVVAMLISPASEIKFGYGLRPDPSASPCASGDKDLNGGLLF